MGKYLYLLVCLLRIVSSSEYKDNSREMLDSIRVQGRFPPFYQSLTTTKLSSFSRLALDLTKASKLVVIL